MTQIRGNRPRKDDVRGESTGRHAQDAVVTCGRALLLREGSSPVSSRAASWATSCARFLFPHGKILLPKSARDARDAPSTSRDSGCARVRSTGRPRSASLSVVSVKARRLPGRVCTRCGCFGGRTRRRSHRRSHRGFAARYRERYRLCCTSDCELMSHSRAFPSAWPLCS